MMMKSFLFAPVLCAVVIFNAHSGEADSLARLRGVPQTTIGGTLASADFEGKDAWPDLASTQPDAAARVLRGPFGTIDTLGSTQPSGGLAASAGIWSGPLAVRNAPANLGKITLAFSLAASSAKPILVRVESYDGRKRRSGGLQTTIYPAAPHFYQRYALDLSTFTAFGKGKFVPDSAYTGFTFMVDSPSWKGVAKPQICLDNFHYASPAYYVSETGKDSNDGRSEGSAFATPQKALDVAGAGDIVVVMNGTYLPASQQGGVAFFVRGGKPAGWISLKNYPGHHPLFHVINSWAGVRIGRPKSSVPADDSTPALAYLEVRGIHVRGEGDVAKAKYPEAIGKADPRTNSNGIMVDGRSEPNKPHHLRFADNLVEYASGCGIGPGEADWVFIEHNVTRNNCWTTMYGTSGISVNGGSNFDGTRGGYRVLIRDNISCGNRTFEPWAAVKRISDGNGIIIDVNQNRKVPEDQRFSGRSLICNNLVFGNGGSGIHAFKSKGVDIVHNSVYLNSTSPELDWGQLFVQQSSDIRMINNIVVAPPDQPINTCGFDGGDQDSRDIMREANIYFGGKTPPIMGEGDLVANPQFVNPSLNAAVANFRLLPTSPALRSARWTDISPVLDLGRVARGPSPSRGAFQH